MPFLAALLALSPQIAKPADIEVPFRKAETAIIVDVKVNGQSVPLMFDTGFSGSVIVDDSVNVGKATGKMVLRDFVGQNEALTVDLKSLSVGSKTLPIEPNGRIVQQEADQTSSYGQKCLGLLGLEAFKGTPFTIDFEHSRFIFHPKSYDVSKRVPDNKKTFLQKLLPMGNSSLELLVTAPNGKSMTLALDTGNSFYATTHRDVLARVGLWDIDKPHKYPRTAFVNSGGVESWYLQMPQLNIFGVTTPPSVWDIIDRPSSSAEGDGTVGYGFLNNFNITVDYGRRRVWLENYKGPISNSEDGDVGLSAYYAPELRRTVVASVTPESPAAVAGIARGDTILMIDGEDLVRVDYKQFRKLMEGKVGSTVRLAVSHGGALKRVELKRALLVNGSVPPAPAGS